MGVGARLPPAVAAVSGRDSKKWRGGGSCRHVRHRDQIVADVSVCARGWDLLCADARVLALWGAWYGRHLMGADHNAGGGNSNDDGGVADRRARDRR